MYWNLFFLASILVLTFSIALAFFENKTKKLHFLNPFKIILGGAFVSTLLLFIPLHYIGFYDDTLGDFKTIVFSLQNTARLFGGGDVLDDLIDNIDYAPGVLNSVYTAICLVLQIIAPILTVSILLSFFKNITGYLRYSLAYFKDAYIFSALNEKSLTLARDIRTNHPDAKIVFADSSDKNGETSYDLSELVSDIGAIVFAKKISALNFSFHSKKRGLSFFMMDDNEIEKIKYSLNLIEKYKERDNIRLFLFSHSVESELLLAGKDTGKIKLRRVNEIRAFVTRVLCEEGVRIFDSATPISKTEKHISAVIVGIGSYGTEMLKSLSWYCQMDGFRLQIDAFDRDKLAEERFSALCPELMSNYYNGVYIDGESQYSINIHSGLDVSSKAFCDEISKLKNANYVFVSLGSDEENIKVAVQLRMLFERIGTKPIIQAIVYNTDVKNSLQSVKNYRGQEYNIDFIGDLKSSYSEKVIINSDIEAAALARHKKWGKEEDFWKYEYNYHSSLASAIHLIARVHCGIVGASKNEDDLTDDERFVIENLEHRRWNAYMRAEGYVYSGSKDKSSRNDLAKMHHDLVNFDDLSDEEKRKDSRVGTV